MTDRAFDCLQNKNIDRNRLQLTFFIVSVIITALIGTMSIITSLVSLKKDRFPVIYNIVSPQTFSTNWQIPPYK